MGCQQAAAYRYPRADHNLAAWFWKYPGIVDLSAAREY